MLENISLINKIEQELFDEAIKLNSPIIEKSLGVIIFEATYYKYSKNINYRKKCMHLLENVIEVFATKELSSGFFEGFEGIFYVVDYMNKCGIVTDESILDDLKPYLLQSLKIDFKENNFDTLHGSIGKLQYLINSKNNKTPEIVDLIHEFIDSLFTNKQETEKGIFWFDDYEEENGLINLGLAHGLPGILTFLVRLKEKGYINPKIDILIEGTTKCLLSFKNNDNYNSSFPDHYAISNNNKDSNSRLGWCYGDLGVSYALLYASKVLKLKNLKTEALKIINAIIIKGISNSKLDHFEDYHFFDTGFCHGLSGITYILSKINYSLKDPILEKRISYWKKELLYNLDKQLKIKEDIYYPWYRQPEDNSFILDKCSMLTGLTGTSLVLLSLHYKKYDWSDIFLLY